MPKLPSRIRLTAGRIDSFTCPKDTAQAFLWDTDTPSLALRATPTGRKTFVFESRLNGATIRVNIGTATDWTIERARSRASELKVMVDSGIDPREVDREKQAAALAKKEAAAVAAKAAQVAEVTVGEVWTTYLTVRRPFWGDLHYQDHVTKAQAGGIPSKRRGQTGKLTQAGPLHSLMHLRLKDLDQLTIEAWAAKEGQTRPTSARLAWRLLTVFLTWCAEQPEYAHLLPAKNPAKTKKAREALGKAGVKRDALQKSQLEAWFTHVRQIPNPAISACLQVLLLTGARLNEVLSLRWEDVNFQWKGIHMHDKVEGDREVPLTPYVESLITALPRRNEFIFSSARNLRMDSKNLARRERKSTAKGRAAPTGAILETSATGHITEPNTPHTRACRAAGIDGLTLHGLRRSFKSLTEWLEVPVGVVAQIQGHKPSATAEKHYTVRPLELLAVHHTRIEAWILEQAEVKFDPSVAATETRLKAV